MGHAPLTPHCDVCQYFFQSLFWVSSHPPRFNKNSKKPDGFSRGLVIILVGRCQIEGPYPLIPSIIFSWANLLFKKIYIYIYIFVLFSACPLFSKHLRNLCYCPPHPSGAGTPSLPPVWTHTTNQVNCGSLVESSSA